MKTALTTFLLVLIASMACSRLQAQSVVSNRRLQPPGNHAGELFGDGAKAIAIGHERLMAGSPRAIQNRNGTLVATGAVYVFDSKTGKLIRTLFPPDGIDGGRFGEALAVSGSVLVVGSPSWGTTLNPNRGAVYLYNWVSGAFIRKVEPSESVNAGDRWGSSVAIEGDVVVYSARDHDGNTMGSNMGMVETYSIQRGVQMASIPGVPFTASRASLNQLGACVAILRGIVAAGAPGSAGGDGGVLLFDAATGAVVHTLLDPKGAGKAGGFGYSLDMDDELLIVGAPFHSTTSGGVQPNAGSAYLFDLRLITAPQALLGSTDGAANQILGASVATRDGLSAVGIPGVDYLPFGPGLGPAVSDYGRVLVMDRRLQRLDVLEVPALGTGARYGTIVSVSPKGQVVASAPGDDGGGDDSGALWLAGPYQRSAEGSFETLAMTQNGALPQSAAVYTNFSEVTASVVATYTASVSGAGTSGGKNNGLWSTLQSRLTPGLVIQTQVPAPLGMPPPASFVTAKKVFRPLCNSASEMYFRVMEASGVTSQYFYDGYSSIGLSKVIDNSTTTYPSLQGVAVQTMGETRVPFSGGLACAIPLKLRKNTGTTPVTVSSDSALYVQGGFYLREGIDDVPMPATGKFGEFNNSLAFADPAHCFYRAFIQNSSVTAGIFCGNNATLVVKESLAPDAAGAVGSGAPEYGSFLGVTGLQGSMARSYLYRATLKLDAAKGITTANNEALYSNLNSTGTKLMARKGDLVPGTSLRWHRFLDYGITAQGQQLVLATLQGAGVTAANDTALIAYIPRFPLEDATLVLLREGDVLPGSREARVASISRIDMSFTATSSSYGALVTLKTEANGATVANNLAWVAGNLHFGNSKALSDYLPRIAFRKGMRLSNQAGRDIVTSISVPSLLGDSSGAGNTGLQHAVFSSAGHPTSMCVITFPDKTKALLRR